MTRINSTSERLTVYPLACAFLSLFWEQVVCMNLNKLARTLGVDPSELIEYIPVDK
jgi:DNA-binding Xre family transcriptional regulator